MLYSTRHPNAGLAIHLMGEINEAKSLAYSAALTSSTTDVASYDAAIARKLALCASLGFPLHVERPLACRTTGRELAPYSPNGWTFVRE